MKNGAADDEHAGGEEEEEGEEVRRVLRGGQVECEVCHTLLTSAYGLDRHLYEAHGQGVFCQQCGLKTERNVAFRRNHFIFTEVVSSVQRLGR